MFDPTLESPIPLLQVPNLPWLPVRRNGRPLHGSTVFRWAATGIRGVRLEVIQLAGTKCTSEAALQRFFRALASPVPPKQPSQATRARRKQIETAESALVGAGFACGG